MPEQHVREARGRVQQDLLHQLLRRYRVLATAQSGRLRPPAGMAKAVPASLLLRLYGIDRVARVCFVIFTDIWRRHGERQIARELLDLERDFLGTDLDLLEYDGGKTQAECSPLLLKATFAHVHTCPSLDVWDHPLGT